MTAAERHRLVTRAGLVTIVANVVITAVRAYAAVVSGSTAVLADMINSGTDIFVTLVVIGGSYIAALPADYNHLYGHDKAEPEAAKLVGIVVGLTGLLTGIGAARALVHPGVGRMSWLATIITLATLGGKEVLARYLIKVGRTTENKALMADATNQRTDVLASAATLMGTLGGRLGVPVLDPAMGLLVAGLILRMGLGLYWRTANELMDVAPDPETMTLLKRAAASVTGVLSVDQLKARRFGPGMYVDCEIGVDGEITVTEGHTVAGRVKSAISAQTPGVMDVLVHVNPVAVLTSPRIDK